jgi:hypothetical protein
MAAHSLCSTGAVPAIVATERHQHRPHSVTSRAALNTIAVAANRRKPRALRPPSVRVVLVVAQTKGVITDTLRLPGQSQRAIAVRTPPLAGHRVNHLDGVDRQVRLSQDLRTPRGFRIVQ